jgi:hypothetical protein
MTHNQEVTIIAHFPFAPSLLLPNKLTMWWTCVANCTLRLFPLLLVFLVHASSMTDLPLRTWLNSLNTKNCARRRLSSSKDLNYGHHPTVSFGLNSKPNMYSTWGESLRALIITSDPILLQFSSRPSTSHPYHSSNPPHLITTAPQHNFKFVLLSTFLPPQIPTPHH